MSSVTQNNTQLLYNMFHESLDELLLESIDSMNNNIVSSINSAYESNTSKNSNSNNNSVMSDKNETYMELSALRDAVQATRLTHYNVQHLFHTFVLSCKLFKESIIVNTYNNNNKDIKTSEQELETKQKSSSSDVERSGKHNHAKSEQETLSLTETESSSTSESITINKVKSSEEEFENSKKIINKTTITNTKGPVIHKVSTRRRLRRRALLLQSITNLSRMASLHLLPSSTIPSSISSSEATQRKDSNNQNNVNIKDYHSSYKVGKQEMRSVEDTLLDLVKWLAISHIKIKNYKNSFNAKRNANDPTENVKKDKVEIEVEQEINKCRRTCTVYLIEHDDELLMRLVQLVSSLMSSASFTPSSLSSSSTTSNLSHVLGTFVLLSSAVNLSAQMETTLQAMLAQSTSLLCNFLKHTEVSKLQQHINTTSSNMFNVAEIMHATSFMKDLVRISTSFTSEVVQPQWLQLSLPLLLPTSSSEKEELNSDLEEETFVASTRFQEQSNLSVKFAEMASNWCIYFPISFKLSLLSFLHSYINEISIQEVHEVSNLLMNVLSDLIVSGSVKLFTATNVRATGESEGSDEFVWFQRFLYLALHIVSKFYKFMTASVQKMIMAHVEYLHRYVESLNKPAESNLNSENTKALSSHHEKIKKEQVESSKIENFCNCHSSIIASQEELQTQCSLIVVLINSWNHVLSNNKHLLYTLMATETFSSSSSFLLHNSTFNVLSLNSERFNNKLTNIKNDRGDDNEVINSTPWRTNRHMSDIFTSLVRNCLELFLTLSQRLSCYNAVMYNSSDDNTTSLNSSISNSSLFHDKVIIGGQQSILSFVHTIFEFIVEIGSQNNENSNNGLTHLVNNKNNNVNMNFNKERKINEEAMLVINSMWSNVHQWTSCIQVALSLPFSSHTSTLFTLLCQTERLFLQNMFVIMSIYTSQLAVMDIFHNNSNDTTSSTRKKRGMSAGNADHEYDDDDDHHHSNNNNTKKQEEYCQAISNVMEEHWTMLIITLLSDNKGMKSLCRYEAQINNTKEYEYETDKQTSSHNTSETNNIDNCEKSFKNTSAGKSLSLNISNEKKLERSELESSVISASSKLLQLPELTRSEQELELEEETLSSQSSSLEQEETELELEESEKEEDVETSLSHPTQTRSSSLELSLSSSSSSSSSLSQSLLSRLFTSPRIAHQRMQKRKVELQNYNRNSISECGRTNTKSSNNAKAEKGKEEPRKDDQEEHFKMKSKWYPNEREFSELFASVQQCNGLFCLKWTLLKEIFLPFIWTPEMLIWFNSNNNNYNSKCTNTSLTEIYEPWTCLATSLLYMDTLLWNIHVTFRTLRDLYMYCNGLAELTARTLMKHKNGKLKTLAHDAKRTFTKNITMASNNGNKNINTLTSKNKLHKFIVYTEQLKTVIETFFDKEWRKEVLHELKESRANLPFYLIRLCAENRVLGVQVLHALLVEYEQQQSVNIHQSNLHDTKKELVTNEENEMHTCHEVNQKRETYKSNQRINHTLSFFTQATWLSKTVSVLTIISYLFTCQTSTPYNKSSIMMLNLMKRFMSTLFASDVLYGKLHCISNLNARELNWFPHICAPLQSTESSQTIHNSAMAAVSSSSEITYETNTAVPYALFALFNNNNFNGGNGEDTTKTVSLFGNNVQARNSILNHSGNMNINRARYGLLNMTSPAIIVSHLLQECINNVCEMIILCTDMSILRRNKELSGELSKQLETSTKTNNVMSLTIDEILSSHSSWKMQFNDHDSLKELVKDTYALWKTENNNSITDEIEVTAVSSQEKTKKVAQLLWETLISALTELKLIVKHELLNDCKTASINAKENVVQTCLLIMSSIVHFTSQFVETFSVEIGNLKADNTNENKNEQATQTHKSGNINKEVHIVNLQLYKRNEMQTQNTNEEKYEQEEEECYKTEEDEKDTWTLLLRLLATAYMNRVMFTTHTLESNFHTSLVKDVNTTVFRILESITQNYISYITSASAIKQLILTIGCIVNASNHSTTKMCEQEVKMNEEVKGETNSEKINESKKENYINEEVNGNVHVELSAVQMLWTVGDYIASSSSSSSLSSEYGLLQYNQHQTLWLTLLEQLKQGVLCQFSSEIRQASLKTFFALLHTYGQLFSQETWIVIWRTMIDTFITLFTDTTQTEQEKDDTNNCLIEEQKEYEEAMLVELRNHFCVYREQWTEMRLTLVEGVSQAIVIYQRCFYKNNNSYYSNNNNSDGEVVTKSMEEENISHVISHFIVLCGSTRYMTREDNTMKCEALTLASVHALRELLNVFFAEPQTVISRKQTRGNDKKKDITCGTNIVKQIWSELNEYIHSTNTHDVISFSRRSISNNNNNNCKEATLFAHVSHNTIAAIINTCVEYYVNHNLHYEEEEEEHEEDQEHFKKTNSFYELLLQILRSSISNTQVIAQAYHFPHNVHLAVISSLRLLFTSFHEKMISKNVNTNVYANKCNALLRLIDDQFPSIHMVKKMVKDVISLYNNGDNNNNNVSEREVRAIMNECLPAGSHLSFCVLLLQLLEFVRGLFGEESFTITKKDNDKFTGEDSIDVQVDTATNNTLCTTETYHNNELLCSVIACKANSQIIIYTSTLLLTEHLLLIHDNNIISNPKKESVNLKIESLELPESFHMTCHQMYTDAVQIFINTLHNSKLEDYVSSYCEGSRQKADSTVVTFNRNVDGKDKEQEEIVKLNRDGKVEECLETIRAFSFILYTHVHFALRLDANTDKTLQLSEITEIGKDREEVQTNTLLREGEHSNSFSSSVEVFIDEMLNYAEQILLYLLTTIFTRHQENRRIAFNKNVHRTSPNIIHHNVPEMECIHVNEEVLEDVSRFIEYVIEISVIANGSMQSIADHASEILHHLTCEVDAITDEQNYKNEFNENARSDINNAIERSSPLKSIVLLLHQSEVARFNYLVDDYVVTNTTSNNDHNTISESVETDMLLLQRRNRTVGLLKQNLTFILQNFTSNATTTCKENSCKKELNEKLAVQRTNESSSNAKYLPSILKLVKYVNVNEQRTQQEIEDEKEIRSQVANILEQQLISK